MDILETQITKIEEAVQDGHLNQSGFKRPPVKSSPTVMRTHWHIKATAGACTDMISSYSVVYQQVHLWKAVLQIRYIYLLVRDDQFNVYWCVESSLVYK